MPPPWVNTLLSALLSVAMDITPVDLLAAGARMLAAGARLLFWV